MHHLLVLLSIVTTVLLDQCYNNEPACWYVPVTDSGYKKGYYPGLGSTATAGEGTAIFGARDSYALFPSDDDGFYLFGGFGYDDTSADVLLNDFWYFTFIDSIATLKWISGSSSGGKKGVYQNEGEFSSSNVIGARKDSTAFWTDDLKCVFGGNSMPEEGKGDSASSIGDMFCYSVEEGEWKFVGGHTNTSSFSFNKEGIWPGQREGAAGWSVQKGSNNYFYLFGGLTLNFQVTILSVNVVLNDFWRYSVSDNSWERLPGDNSFEGYANFGGGISGNTFNFDNYPPSYVYSTTWVSGNSLFLFGGNKGKGATEGLGIGNYRNDFWEYDWVEGMWKTLYYAEADNENPVYSGNSQMPGAKKESLGWVYDQKLFLFGGYIKIDDSVSNPYNVFNDLFAYDLRTREWNYFDTLSDNEGLIDPTKANGEGRDSYDEEFPSLYIYPSPRSGVKGVVSNNKLYFIGGENGEGYFQDVTYMMIEHKCYNLYVSDSDVCSGHGTCNEDGTCTCDDDTYLGDDCSIDTSDSNVDVDTPSEILTNLLPIPIAILSISAILFPLIITGIIVLGVFMYRISLKKVADSEKKVELESGDEGDDEKKDGGDAEKELKKKSPKSYKKKKTPKSYKKKKSQKGNKKKKEKKKHHHHKTQEEKENKSETKVETKKEAPKEETKEKFTVARLSFV